MSTHDALCALFTFTGSILWTQLHSSVLTPGRGHLSFVCTVEGDFFLINIILTSYKSLFPHSSSESVVLYNRTVLNQNIRVMNVSHTPPPPAELWARLVMAVLLSPRMTLNRLSLRRCFYFGNFSLFSPFLRSCPCWSLSVVRCADTGFPIGTFVSVSRLGCF